MIESGVPQIIPKDLFERAQKTLVDNKKAPAKRKASDEYLLTTKIFCGDCGSLIVGEIGTGKNHKQYRYYKCVGAKRKRGCGRRKGIKKDLIENFVFSHIMKTIMDDELIELIIDIAMKEQGKENTALPALKKQLSDIDKSIENLLDAIQNSIFTPSTKERLAKLEASKEETEILIAREKISKPIIPRKCIRYWLYELRKLNIENPEARRFLINTFLNSVVVFKDKIEFVFNYREGTETVPFDILIGISDTYYGSPPKIVVLHSGRATVFL